MTEEKMDVVGQSILTMSGNELDEIIDVVHYRRKVLNKKAKLNFNVGDAVWLEHNGGKIKGTVKKINRTRIKVKTDRTMFNCSPTLIHHDLSADFVVPSEQREKE